MPNLPQSLSDSLGTFHTTPSDRVPRDVVRAVKREHGHGLVRAARLDARAHVTRTALLNTALLTKDEESFIQFAPLGEARYKAIVDAYAIYATGEVARP